MGKIYIGMPFEKISDAPKNLRKLNGAKLTLAQINSISRIADAIDADSVDSPFAVAIASFKKSHTVKNGKWVKKDSNENKSFTFVEKQEDGRYSIVAISTVALKDREEETFTIEAIDFDIQLAEKTGVYPEFRMFHHRGLGIGHVTKMSRVGIFAVDSGISYDDPFSIHVMKEMLLDNKDGRWRVSRGFRTLEVAGGCPDCGEDLLITMKHMIVGFRCPNCGNVHATYKGILDDVRFMKTWTFDDTITDIPSVPWTGVSASYIDIPEELIMTKKQLKRKLLKAGIPEDLVDERLKQLSAEQLEEIDDIPFATMLKELEQKAHNDEEEDEVDDEVDDEDEEDNPKPKSKSKKKKKSSKKKEYHSDGQVFTLDEDVIDLFADTVKKIVTKVVKKEVASALDTALDELEIESPDIDLENVKISVDEIPVITELKELVEDMVDILKMSDEERVKQLVKDLPRSAGNKLRIIRKKSVSDDDASSEESTDDYLAKAFGRQKDDPILLDPDGNPVETMTEFLAGAK